MGQKFQSCNFALQVHLGFAAGNYRGSGSANAQKSVPNVTRARVELTCNVTLLQISEGTTSMLLVHVRERGFGRNLLTIIMKEEMIYTKQTVENKMPRKELEEMKGNERKSTND